MHLGEDECEVEVESEAWPEWEPEPASVCAWMLTLTDGGLSMWCDCQARHRHARVGSRWHWRAVGSIGMQAWRVQGQNR